VFLLPFLPGHERAKLLRMFSLSLKVLLALAAAGGGSFPEVGALPASATTGASSGGVGSGLGARVVSSYWFPLSGRCVMLPVSHRLYPGREFYLKEPDAGTGHGIRFRRAVCRLCR